MYPVHSHSLIGFANAMGRILPSHLHKRYVKHEGKNAMKYLTFDYKSLIRDFQLNRNAVVALDIQIKQLEEEMQDPFRSSVEDVRVELDSARIRRQEYQMYVDMVILGFNALAEEERRIIELYFLEGHTNQECADILYMSSRDFDRKKARALRHFLNVVYP